MLIADIQLSMFGLAECHRSSSKERFHLQVNIIITCAATSLAVFER